MSFSEIVETFRTFDVFTQQRLLEVLTEELSQDPLSPAEEAELNERADRASREPSRPLEEIAAELGH